MLENTENFLKTCETRSVYNRNIHSFRSHSIIYLHFKTIYFLEDGWLAPWAIIHVHYDEEQMKHFQTDNN